MRGKLKADAPLAPLVWFKSGGNAQYLFEPADLDDLTEFLRDLDPDVPVMALGLGSNMIVRDGGVPGRRGPSRQAVLEDLAAWPDDASNAAAGLRGFSCPRPTRDAGIAGLEFLRGIPGTVGGFVRMNGGAYGREVSDILRSCTIGSAHRARSRNGRPSGLRYSYRHSELPEQAVVVAATFDGVPGDPAVIGAEMDRIAAAREESQPLAAAPAARPSRIRRATRRGR